MSVGTFTDQRVHKWLQDIADAGWVSLHYDSPALDGIGGSEISGGGYARVKVDFTQPTNRAIWSITDARWTGLVQTTLTHFGVWDSQVKGSLEGYGLLPSKVIILTGKGYVIKAGNLALSFA
jgi:hypothetical protein